MAAGTVWPYSLQWTEDKDRAGTLAWGTCYDSATSLGGILTQRPEIPEPSQQQLLAAGGGRGGEPGQGVSPQPTLQEGQGPHCGLPQPMGKHPERLPKQQSPQPSTVFMEKKMLLIKATIAKRWGLFSEHLLQASTSAQSCQGGNTSGMEPVG